MNKPTVTAATMKKGTAKIIKPKKIKPTWSVPSAPECDGGEDSNDSAVQTIANGSTGGTCKASVQEMEIKPDVAVARQTAQPVKRNERMAVRNKDVQIDSTHTARRGAKQSAATTTEKSGQSQVQERRKHSMLEAESPVKKKAKTGMTTSEDAAIKQNSLVKKDTSVTKAAPVKRDTAFKQEGVSMPAVADATKHTESVVADNQIKPNAQYIAPRCGPAMSQRAQDFLRTARPEMTFSAGVKLDSQKAVQDEINVGREVERALHNIKGFVENGKSSVYLDSVIEYKSALANIKPYLPATSEDEVYKPARAGSLEALCNEVAMVDDLRTLDYLKTQFANLIKDVNKDRSEAHEAREAAQKARKGKVQDDLTAKIAALTLANKFASGVRTMVTAIRGMKQENQEHLKGKFEDEDDV